MPLSSNSKQDDYTATVGSKSDNEEVINACLCRYIVVNN
jgi:hypothetical protein